MKDVWETDDEGKTFWFCRTYSATWTKVDRAAIWFFAGNSREQGPDDNSIGLRTPETDPDYGWYGLVAEISTPTNDADMT